MAESTLPQYLSHDRARTLLGRIDEAIDDIRTDFLVAGAEPVGLDREITMTLARMAAARGMDVWPHQQPNGHTDEDIPPLPVGPKISGEWPSDLKVSARTAVAGVRVEGAGSLTDLAITELMIGWEDGSVREFLARAERYFAGMTMTIRKIERSPHTRIVVFHVGVG